MVMSIDRLEMSSTLDELYSILPQEALLVASRWKVGKKLGEGTYGEVYKASDIYSTKQVAIKLEEIFSNYSSLKYEYEVYCVLNRNHHKVNIPKIHFFGQYEDSQAMVMDCLGPSLESTMTKSEMPFKLSFVANAACQLLSILEFIHDQGVLHCDLKPSNIVHDLRDPNIVHIIDFGLARQFKCKSTVRLRHVDDGHGYLGCHDFSPLAAHFLKTPGRRDDLESLGYMLLYMFNGSLPWFFLTFQNLEVRNVLVKREKSTLSPTQLCEGVPGEFVLYFQYVQTLQLNERPRYEFLRSLFKKLVRSDSGL